jgi:hypothetical protein
MDLQKNMQKLHQRYFDAMTDMKNKGFTASKGSWIDEEMGRYYVCSTKTSGQYRHPVYEISGNEHSEWRAL